MPFPTDKFGLLPDYKQQEVIQRALDEGSITASKEFYLEIGMVQQSLKQRLDRELKKTSLTTTKPTSSLPAVKEDSKTSGLKKNQRELSKEEKLFLQRMEEGKVTFDEASRIVATKVFTNMLRNPDDFKYVDFFRTELLKIKQQESVDKNTWMIQIINRFFAGKLPPKNCPKCGFHLFEAAEPRALPVMEGELVES